MTDINKVIMEKAQGGVKLNPDEQRRFLGTFEERVLGYADLETADDDKFEKGGFLMYYRGVKNLTHKESKKCQLLLMFTLAKS